MKMMKTTTMKATMSVNGTMAQCGNQMQGTPMPLHKSKSLANLSPAGAGAAASSGSSPRSVLLSRLRSGPASPKPHQTSDPNWSYLERAERDRLAESGGIQGLRMSDFAVRKKLGTGSSATVYLVELKTNPLGLACDRKPKFALKCFHKKDFDRKNRVRRVLTEHSILCGTDHPFVVALYRTFNENGSVAFLMEHCERGDLYQMLQRVPVHGFPELQAKTYAAQVVVALQYLHVQGYVYRDLKPENILVCGDGHVKLTDFDLSRQVDPPALNIHRTDVSTGALRRGGNSGGGLKKAMSSGNLQLKFEQELLRKKDMNSSSSPPSPSLRPVREAGEAKGSSSSTASPTRDKSAKARASMRLVAVPEMRSTSFVGTDEYIAPEIITCRGYTSSVDWWSVGILVYELVYGVTPFASKNRNECFKRILEEELSFPQEPRVSGECKALIEGLLAKDPAARLGSRHGASEIKNHPFFAQVQWALLRHSN